MNCTYSKCVYALILLIAFGYAPATAQTAKATLHGRITDPSASSIPGAVVVLTGEPKVQLKRTTDLQGLYTFADIPAASYTITVTKPGFAPFQVQDYAVKGNASLDVPMVVQAEAEKITVRDEIGSQVSVDPDQNAGALVLRGKDLDTLSDDPDQLQDDLQALAGPSAGPNGGQIFIDGYSNGTLPPKSSIREIRVNQNPFSAAYDRLGFGRVEVFTKPGTDRYHGQFMTMFGDNMFNARNPFVADKPSFQSRIFDGNFGGPLSKSSSFTIDVEHRGIDDVAVINARDLDPVTLQMKPDAMSLPAPQERWHVVPRVDVQLTPKNTLTTRYGWSQSDSVNPGGGFSLPSTGSTRTSTQHTLQMTETAVLSTSAINETRFEYERSTSANTPNIFAGLAPTTAAINVRDAFSAGNSQLGIANSVDNYWEVQNTTSKTAGRHAWKFGGRMRADSLRDLSPGNFGGAFTFNTLERYQLTEQLLSQGLSPAQVAAAGGGANQFSISGGNPVASVSQIDVGLFILDDWRLRPNLTLSYGLRYENQTNISDNKDFSPRLSLAWGIDGGAKRAAKTVLRAGFGVFYDRFADSLTLQALRFNGTTQQQYIVTNPDFFPVVPSVETLAAQLSRSSVYRTDPALRAPYIAQTAIGIDRQLPRNSTMSVTYTFSRGLHELRTRDVNAPLNGAYPLGNPDPVFQYESTGSLRQQQLITNLRTNLSRKVMLFGYYVLNFANSDTDGAGTLPANFYDLRPEWGSARFDVRNRLFVGGSLTAPKRVTLSPFITASSGAPFNITDGVDYFNDGAYTQRPALAAPGTPGAIVTPWGVFNPTPGPGDTIIPRNDGRGPGQFTVNLRLSRTWGFGKRTESAANSGRGGGMPTSTFGGAGGRGGGGRGGRGGPGGMFGDASSGRRFNLTLGVMAHNALNRVNLTAPNGNLLSPVFGQSLAIAASGPSSASSNRRIDFQLRLSF
jgi:hypothetical protein